jgi:chromosome segregation ATPase
MDDHVCEDVSREVWSDDFSRSLAQLRRGADELLKGERGKWQSAEAVLLRQIVELRETIAREESRGETLREELAGSRKRLDEETTLLNEVVEQARHRQESAQESQARLEQERRAFLDEFAKKSGDLELARRELSVAQEEIAKRRESLAMEVAKLEQRSQEIASKHVAVQVKTDEQRTAAHELETEKKKLSDLRAELDHAKQALDRERDLLQIRQRETAAQRRRLAREFRLQRMQLLAEVHQGVAASSTTQSATRPVEDDSQIRLLREEIAVRTKQQETLEHQLLEQREFLAASSAEEERLRQQLEEARAAAGNLAGDQQAIGALRQQLAQLQQSLEGANAERKTLQTALHSEREQQSQQESRRKRDQETLEHEVQQLREQLQRGVMEAENELVESRMAVAQSKVEQDRQREQLAALRKQLDAKIGEIASLKNQSAHGDATGDALVAMDELRVERDALLKEVESLKSSAHASDDHGSEVDDLRHRIEMAMADLRQANSQIADLKRQLAQKNAASGGAHAPESGGAGDWEHQKRLLLAQLEADDVTTPAQKKERLKIEDVIAKTNSVVAEKEAEIAELKSLLEMRPQGGAGAAETAFGAAAISQLLDGDELVKQQREALERMTRELQEKLRQAEIDTSLERAKLARERAELHEQIQKLQDERAKSPDNPGRSDDKLKSPGRRNWLDHLGLNKNQTGG